MMSITTNVNGKVIRLDTQVTFEDCLSDGVEIGHQIYAQRYVMNVKRRVVSFWATIRT